MNYLFIIYNTFPLLTAYLTATKHGQYLVYTKYTYEAFIKTSAKVPLVQSWSVSFDFTLPPK